MQKLAPIIIFTYKRLNTLKKCINSIKKNELSKKSKVYFFSDGPKSKKEKKDIDKVRKYLKKVKFFKTKNIFIRKNNCGLAKNIMHGVSKVIKKEGKAIILEDDIIVSKNFLSFMNLSLLRFEKNRKIWHISAWNYNLNLSIKEDAYLTRGMNCWGWATWKDRWKHFKKKPKEILKTWSKNDIKEFNFENSINFFSQIVRNSDKRLNSWAIFWYATIFKEKGLCLNPKYSLSQNIGVDKNSTNTKSIEKFFDTKLINTYPKKYSYPFVIKENMSAYKQIRKKIKINTSIKLVKKFLNIND